MMMMRMMMALIGDCCPPTLLKQEVTPASYASFREITTSWRKTPRHLIHLENNEITNPQASNVKPKKAPHAWPCLGKAKWQELGVDGFPNLKTGLTSAVIRFVSFCNHSQHETMRALPTHTRPKNNQNNSANYKSRSSKHQPETHSTKTPPWTKPSCHESKNKLKKTRNQKNQARNKKHYLYESMSPYCNGRTPTRRRNRKELRLWGLGILTALHWGPGAFKTFLSVFGPSSSSFGFDLTS